MNTIKFYTFGCKANQYDTQQIRESFLGMGLREAGRKEDADVYLINTCTVTGKADSESLNCIRRAERENPKAKIVVTGCLAELDSRAINKQGRINLIVKNSQKEKIAQLFSRINGLKRIKDCRGITDFSGHTRAFLKIQDGCDNCCSYCKVPLARGHSVSKHLTEILRETHSLVDNGFKEIVLTGICLGAYGRDFRNKGTLVEVIEALEKIKGLSRIRLSSIEASDISDELLSKISESAKLCPHLHIPIQSGDDGILEKMGRRYTGKDYLRLAGKARKKIPKLAITTDILVGFPGEDEAAFGNTLRLLKNILPLKVHIFPYSPREKTRAAKFRGLPDPAAVNERIERARGTAQDCSLKYRNSFLKKDMQVLIEGKIKTGSSLWEGYSENYIKARVSSKINLANQMVCVKCREIFPDFVRADFN